MAQSALASMGGPFPIPPEFRERPPVAALVYIVLHEADRPVRVRELAALIGRPEKTIRHHTRQLADDGLIAKQPDCHDGRRNVYSLSTSDD